MKHCIIYTRFSPRPDAKECDSCEKQWNRCYDYARNKSYTLHGHFIDEGVSGGSLLRPGLQEALGALQSDWVLVVDRTDRLARDMLVGYAIRKQVEDAGATIEYADGTPAGSTPEEKFLQGIMLLVASFERDRIVARTKAGMDRKKKAGERVGQIPIGWKLDPDDSEEKQLIRNMDEWQEIKRICRMKSRGFPIQQITNYLNELGLANRQWNARTVRRLWRKHRHWACPKIGNSSLEPDHPI